MSFSSHRIRALDASLPIAHRASHARSCAVCVCEKLRVPRSKVIEEIQKMCGVNLNDVTSGSELIDAIEALESIRFGGINGENT